MIFLSKLLFYFFWKRLAFLSVPVDLLRMGFAPLYVFFHGHIGHITVERCIGKL